MKPSPVEQVRRINRTWLVQGNLAETTAAFLDLLEQERPEVLRTICADAVAAARRASDEHRDPKPDFYATVFSVATDAERDRFLQNHAWTRRLSAERRVEPPRETASK